MVTSLVHPPPIVATHIIRGAVVPAESSGSGIPKGSHGAGSSIDVETELVVPDDPEPGEEDEDAEEGDEDDGEEMEEAEQASEADEPGEGLGGASRPAGEAGVPAPSLALLVLVGHRAGATILGAELGSEDASVSRKHIRFRSPIAARSSMARGPISCRFRTCAMETILRRSISFFKPEQLLLYTYSISIDLLILQEGR